MDLFSRTDFGHSMLRIMVVFMHALLILQNVTHHSVYQLTATKISWTECSEVVCLVWDVVVQKPSWWKHKSIYKNVLKIKRRLQTFLWKKMLLLDCYFVINRNAFLKTAFPRLSLLKKCSKLKTKSSSAFQHRSGERKNSTTCVAISKLKTKDIIRKLCLQKKQHITL